MQYSLISNSHINMQYGVYLDLLVEHINMGAGQECSCPTHYHCMQYNTLSFGMLIIMLPTTFDDIKCMYKPTSMYVANGQYSW